MARASAVLLVKEESEKQQYFDAVLAKRTRGTDTGLVPCRF